MILMKALTLDACFVVRFAALLWQNLIHEMPVLAAPAMTRSMDCRIGHVSTDLRDERKGKRDGRRLQNSAWAG